MEQPRLEPYLGEEKPLVPPKSLGELCIGVAQETLLEGVSVVPAFPGHRVVYIEWTQITDRFPNLEVNISISRRDIQELRERMWHKGFSGLLDLADPTLEASILFLRGTHINPYKWRP